MYKINIKDLLDYKLKLRGNLNLPNNTTFGMELEFENIKSINEFENKFKELKLNNGKINILNHNTNIWELKIDNTLIESNGREIVSPILTDDIIYWQDLVKMCSFIKKHANIGSHSAGHIHIGSQVLGNDIKSLLSLIKVWATYENILYRFGFNEYLNRFPNIKYSKPASYAYLNIYDKCINEKNIENIIELLIGRIKPINFNLLNFMSNKNNILYKDTLEFRSPNATLDPIIWQNNVNTFVKLLLACKNKIIDCDIVNRRRKLFEYKIDRCNYNTIDIETAIEFADLIFDNELDKLYFLRQYIKNNDISYMPMKRTKKFTI